MPIYQDYFEGRALGQLTPIGNLKTVPFHSPASIVAPGENSNKALQGIFRYDDGLYYSDFSVFFGYRQVGTVLFGNQILVGLGDYPSPIFVAPLFALRLEPDATISLINGPGTAILANSNDFSIHHDRYYLMQANVSLFDPGTGHIFVSVTLAVDGVTVLSGSGDTGATISQLVNHTPAIRFIQHENGASQVQWDSYTLDSLQPIPTYEVPGTPNARVSDAVNEIVKQPSTANLRVSDGVVELVDQPSTANMRVSDGVIELVTGTPVPPPPLSIACPINSTGTVGSPFSSQVQASGGTPPYTFTLIGGSLPPGLSMSSTGAITGTPTASGNFTYQVKVTDSLGNNAQIVCTIGIDTIPPPPPEPSTCGLACGPKLYFWEPSFLERPEDTYLRATDWDNCGYDGSKFMQGFLLEADTEGVIRTIKIQGDQQDVQTFQVLHSGQQTIAYSFENPGIFSLMRLIGDDTDELWRLFKIKWIFEPSPNLALVWETQGTDHDIPGWQFLKDGYIAHMSTADITLTITVDGTNFVYTIPNSGGVYKKTYILFSLANNGLALKGKLFQYRLESTNPNTGFRLFVKDTEVRVHAWSGETNVLTGPPDYVVKHPFGDTSRVYGATI